MKVIHEPEQRTVKHTRNAPRPCVEPSLMLQASPESTSAAAEVIQGDLDEINTMISEGGPTLCTASLTHGCT